MVSVTGTMVLKTTGRRRDLCEEKTYPLVVPAAFGIVSEMRLCESMVDDLQSAPLDALEGWPSICDRNVGS